MPAASKKIIKTQNNHSCVVKVADIRISSIIVFRKEIINYAYDMCVPVVSYGAEAWAVTKKDEQALLVFERKIFRRINGPKYENGECKSRTN